MNSYFDEEEVKKRVTRYYRRRFLASVHGMITLFLVAMYVIEGIRLWRSWGMAHAGSILLPQVALVILALLLHTMWVTYREQIERAIEAQLRDGYTKRKHDHLQPFRLEADGELIEVGEDELYDDDIHEQVYRLIE